MEKDKEKEPVETEPYLTPFQIWADVIDWEPTDDTLDFETDQGQLPL